MMLESVGNKVWYAVYDEASDAAAAVAEAAVVADKAAADKAAADKAAADKAAAEAAAAAAAAAGGGGGKTKQFSQEDVNRFVAAEKRKDADKRQIMIDELEALKTKSTLNEDDRTAFDNHIKTLKDELLTKDELTKQAKEKTDKKHLEEVTSLTTDRDGWKDRYNRETITRAITDAAAQNDAYVPEQIVAIVQPNTRLDEELNDEGKPTGKLVPKVKLQDVDSDGKPVTLELTVPEAIKRMKEMQQHFNLFKGEGTGGVGGMNRGGGKGELDKKELAKDPIAWRKARKEGKI